eukprot:TRINITY_DN1946_c0_g1_i5.p3 TRINITY_DN1946_c0_g1~~TRINITY_DN1946_c0_g1_i5.p3  ORF type:complete len:146 (+),score=0.64 TRINITY_DN1946_c0_g1_i5:129-566(+)
MLRFASFTIGSAWASDYGDVTNPEHYAALRAYSPLHNVRNPDANGVPYPATLLTTGDHDDRVCPAHSLKFAAALQAVAGESATQVESGAPCSSASTPTRDTGWERARRRRWRRRRTPTPSCPGPWAPRSMPRDPLRGGGLSRSGG